MNRPLMCANASYEIEVILTNSGLTNSEKINLLAEKLHRYTVKAVRAPKEKKGAITE